MTSTAQLSPAPLASIAECSGLKSIDTLAVQEVTAEPIAQRGREPVIPTPAVEMSAGWAAAWTGFHLRLRAENRAPGTISNRKCSFHIMARHATHAGIDDPGAVTEEWMTTYLLDQREGRKGNGFTSLYEDLRAFWRWWSGKYEEPSPMANFPRPKLVSSETHVLSEDELAAILDTCKNKRDFQALRNRALILVLLDSGLRRAELAALDVDDVDFETHEITVKCGKGGKPRVSALGPAAEEAIYDYRRARDMRVHKSVRALFVSVYGQRLSAGGINQLMARIGQRAGIDLHPHMLRHAMVHYALLSGVQEHEVMTLCGWSTPAQLGRYGAARARERAVSAGVKNALSGRLRKLDQAKREPWREADPPGLPLSAAMAGLGGHARRPCAALMSHRYQAPGRGMRSGD